LTLAALDDNTLELADGRWRLVVAPSQGGSLLACEHDGIAILKPTAQPPAPGRPPMTCCHFPMIPFSNRIENSRFNFRGAPVELAENVSGSPHALHGHGWRAAWQVIERRRSGCTLSFFHAATREWPWAYEGRQTIALAADELRITLGIQNLAPGEMPCGLGFHPFLPRTEDARLSFQAAEVWDGGAGAFPTMRVAVPASLDFRDGPRVADRQGTDHCFDGWQGRATVSGSTMRELVLEGSEQAHILIVYIPEGADYFCIEPVTHAVNAMNLPDAAESGLWVLAPREAREISMTIRSATIKGDGHL
jgi:aldose 1-epimerase